MRTSLISDTNYKVACVATMYYSRFGLLLLLSTVIVMSLTILLNIFVWEPGRPGYLYPLSCYESFFLHNVGYQMEYCAQPKYQLTIGWSLFDNIGITYCSVSDTYFTFQLCFMYSTNHDHYTVSNIWSLVISLKRL